MAPILVHIDMKGGPPTLDYLLQLLPLLKSWGATGILIEWEDMFPYWGTLKVPDVLCFESFFQCCGSGSTGSTCFWASRIRIH